MKTKFDSIVLNDMPKGCKLCLKGEKLVLFLTGACSRNCKYCSLSTSRKKSKKIYANERPCKSVKDAVKEVIANRAKGAGITGGDPLLNFDLTIKYAKALKKKFGKSFHIHIYLPTELATKEKLKKLSKYIDEIRFHPRFLIKSSQESFNEDIRKIEIAKRYFGRNNTGLEMPVIPEQKQNIIDFIKKCESNISFVNLNELEISETNFKTFSKKYNFKENTHSISTSSKAAKDILRKFKNSFLKFHFCTAKTKDVHQYQNRLKKHITLPFAHKQGDGSVVYFAIYEKQNLPLKKIKSKLKHHKKFFIDKNKKRIILSQEILDEILAEDIFKIARVVEHPTFDQTVMEFWEV